MTAVPTAADLAGVIRAHQPTVAVQEQPDRTRLVRCRCGQWVSVRPDQVLEDRFAVHLAEHLAGTQAVPDSPRAVLRQMADQLPRRYPEPVSWEHELRAAEILLDHQPVRAGKKGGHAGFDCSCGAWIEGDASRFAHGMLLGWHQIDSLFGAGFWLPSGQGSRLRREHEIRWQPQAGLGKPADGFMCECGTRLHLDTLDQLPMAAALHFAEHLIGAGARLVQQAA